MAKKRKKAALPKRLNPQEVDFYLYKSEPHTTGSLRTAPKEKSFDKDEQLVAFYNGNDNPIRLSFLGPLQASPNPLAIGPGDTGEVKINPVAPGRFPCRVEILLAICPTCSSTLKGSDVLKAAPGTPRGDRSGRFGLLCGWVRRRRSRPDHHHQTTIKGRPLATSVGPNLVTTGTELHGCRVVRHLGIVRGTVVRSQSVFGTVGASLQTLVGGNITFRTSRLRRCARGAARRSA